MRFLSGWSLWQRMGLAAALGAIGAFGQAPNNIWIATVTVLLLIPALFLSVKTRWRAAWIGWAFGTGYFGHSLFWIIEPFMVDPERHAWMAPFALLFMAGGLALFWGVAFFFAAAQKMSPARRVWILILLLSLAEFARGYILTGFPWANFAQIWIETDVALLLAWVGPNGLVFLTLLVTLTPGYALTRGKSGVLLLRSILPALIFGAAAFAAGRSEPAIESSGKMVRLVQPNAPQHQKWDPEFAPQFLRRQISFTAAEPDVDLVVWPETSVPYWLSDAGDVLEIISEAARGSTVVLGINRTSGPRIYNSIVVLDHKGAISALYDKYHLVPFGEYVPFGNLMASFGISGFATNRGQGFSSGIGPDLIELENVGRAIPLICYEAVFPQDILAVQGRPDLLLQITNDAWFGTRSGPYQHLAQARMRAIEQGAPMVRAANTGISAMIDPLGRVAAYLPLGEAGYIDAELPQPLPPTTYSQMGDLPLLLALLSLCLGALGIQRQVRVTNAD